MKHILSYLFQIILIVLFVLISVAYFTQLERKLLSAIQRRKGPNVVGIFGLLQPLADGLKLFSKETVLPNSANKSLFLIAPLITFILSLIGWSVVPFHESVVLSDINLGILYIFAVSSLGVYGIIVSGWASNSKYAFLGALRSAAQMVSYEISIGFIIIAVALSAGSLNLSDIVIAQKTIWFVFPLFPMAFLFFISCLAETNRHPFDLPEAEAELVSGYNVEYSAMTFALFFLGEYANMILMSLLCALFFLGGWFPFIRIFTASSFFSFSIWLGIKTCVFTCLFIWARAAYPRYRYDQLMRLGWKIFLPLSLGYLLFTSGVLLSFNWLF